MTRGKYCDYTVPIVWFELVWRIDDNETCWCLRVDRGQRSCYLQHTGSRSGRCGGKSIGAGFEKSFDVGHAEEGGGRRGEEDDGVTWAVLAAAAGIVGTIVTYITDG